MVTLDLARDSHPPSAAAAENSAPLRRHALDVTGRVDGEPALRSPLHRAPCVLYQVRLGPLSRLVDGWRRGRTAELGGVRFALRCRLGLVLVDPRGARLHLRRGGKHRRGGGGPGDARRRRELLARLGRPVWGEGHGAWALSLSERWLAPGERVWVDGELLQIPHPGGAPGSYRDAPTLALLMANTVVVL